MTCPHCGKVLRLRAWAHVSDTTEWAQGCWDVGTDLIAATRALLLWIVTCRACGEPVS